MKQRTSRDDEAAGSVHRVAAARLPELPAGALSTVDAHLGSAPVTHPDPARLRALALLAALDLGIAGNLLLNVPGAPGLNVAIYAVLGAAVVLVLARERLRADVRALLGIAVLFALLLAGRDAEALRALNLLAALLAAALAAALAGSGGLRGAGLRAHGRALAGVGVALLLGPVVLGRGLAWPTARSGVARRALAVLRGAALAVPVLLVFGALLGAADPVFQRLLARVFDVPVEAVVEDLLVIAWLAWLSAGYLGHVLVRRERAAEGPAAPPIRVGITETTLVLGLVNAMFLAFVAIQFRYLFGGARLVEVMPGLGYAEYARRGFFELVTVSALVVPLLLVLDWVTVRRRAADAWVFRGFATGQILLLFAIMASALWRMRIYQQAFGLTEQRLYATVFMCWIAFVLVWLAATVLRGRPARFAGGALLAGFGAVLMLNAVNPHARIVRVNAARVAEGRVLDAAYLLRLDGDAVPMQISRLDRLPAAAGCAVAGALLEEWQGARTGGWRTWNWGDWRARRAVGASARELSRMAARCPAPS